MITQAFSSPMLAEGIGAFTSKFEKGGNIATQNKKELKKLLKLRKDLENKKIRPMSIIGKGYEHTKARRLAFEYLDEQIAKLQSMDKMAKGGKLAKVEIVNQGEKFNADKYKGILSDYDKDGIPNADDPNPVSKKKDEDSIEQMKFTDTFKKVLETKKDLDVDMEKFVAKLQSKAPSSSKIYARTKTPFSILNKLVSSRLLNEKHGLKDLVGTTIAFEDYADLKKFADKVRAGQMGKVLDYDDYYQNPKDGYRAYHFIIEQGGVPIELQLKTERMKQINVLSHDAYKNKNLNTEYMSYLTDLGAKADSGDTNAIAEFDEIMKKKHLVEQRLGSRQSHKMAEGSKFGENKAMVMSDNLTMKHHTNELENALKDAKEVPAWVVAKTHKASGDLSDITHYMENKGKFAKGGEVSFLDKIKKYGKSGYEKSKNYAKGKVKEANLKTAVNVLNETSNKVHTEKERMVLDNARKTIINKYEKGGSVKKGLKVAKKYTKLAVRKSKPSEKIGFDALAKKVAKSYEGDAVKKKYQKLYGKVYSKKEAEEVGRKVASKVYRQQQGMK